MRFIFLLILFPLFGFASSHALFTPPEGWKQADPKSVTKRTIIAFLHTKKSGFCPSINLTKEIVKLPIDAYLKIVQKKSQARKRSWKHLGQIETKGGMAELIEIEVQTRFGPARLLQAILLKDNVAHILTAGALKKQFGKYLPQFETTLRSLSVSEDLFSLVTEEKRTALTSAWKKKQEYVESKELEEMVAECAHLGIVWQTLMLKL
ncbi:MAG: hypothetical protein KR126chlam1_00632 [Chlamydiae bacterium]|nr:hypothetical protein [Chlamydiota bacterium]